MNLTADNIEEWKSELTKVMEKKHGIKDYGNSLSNKEWLENHEGYSVEEAIEIEEESFDEAIED